MDNITLADGSTAEDVVATFFSKLGERLGFKLNVSSLAFPMRSIEGVEGSTREVESHLALYGRGAVRIDLIDTDIITANIWTKPGDLTKPDYVVDMSYENLSTQIMIVADVILGKGNQYIRKTPALQEHEIQFQESVKEDVIRFLDSLGSTAVETKLSILYHRYITWAAMNQAKPISGPYFQNIAKVWIAQRGGTPYVSSSSVPMEIATTSAEETEFVGEIMNNEVIYKATMLENIIRRMAQNDPGIAALFLCGAPGLGKSYVTKKVLREEGVWDRVIWRTGSIAGFTGLLQLLWDYRQGKIIVLDDNDRILFIPSATNLLKGALNTNPEDRIISYTRMRRG